jgi:tRNA(Ile)-lysidine synthase
MLKNKVQEALARYGLLSRGQKVLVGVSGGPDSVALLHLLNGMRKELAISLHAAHFDHGLRPGSSRDRKFVEEFCRKLNIPLTCGSAPAGSLCRGGSLEEAARKARLEFFARAAKRFKASCVALGHNLDDQAETVLMRIIRGTGLYGLSAISPKRKIGAITLIRPLLGVTRREILAYLRKKRLSFRTDPTNLGDEYLRNKLRNSLLPLLEIKYNPKIKKSLAALAQTSSLDYEFLEQAAEARLRRMGGSIKLTRFAALHPAMQKMLIRLVIARSQGDTRRIGNIHVKEIEDLALRRPRGSLVDLPKGLSVLKGAKKLRVLRKARLPQLNRLIKTK